MKTALDKFYQVFDNPKKDDVFFDYDGLSYQLSSCCYIFTWRTEDGEDEQEYGFDGKVFSDEDPAKPELPMHPNCRCKFVKQKTPEKNIASALSNTSDTKLLAENRSTPRQKLSDWRDATFTALEMKYLPTGIGEMTGGIKVASIAVTDYGIWAVRARNVVSKSKKLNDDEKLNIYEKLAEALAKKDIRTILLIHEKYK